MKRKHGIFFGIAVLLIAAMFTVAGCGDSGSGDPTTPSGGNPQTVTYTGIANSVTYTLKITENTARYVAQSGDAYELTAGSKKGTGTVSNVSDSTLTLAPSKDPTETFTATVSANSLTAMLGTITWDNSTTENSPSTFTPSGGGDETPSGPGTGGNPVLDNGEIWRDDDPDRQDQGMLFTSDNLGKTYIYFLVGGTWGSPQQTGQWTGNTINTTGDTTGRPGDSTFTVSGNKLYEYYNGNFVASYTKITGQTISGQSNGNAGSFVGTWIGGQGNTGRFVINDDNTWSIGTEAPIVGFVSQYIGTYTVSGGTATFTGTSSVGGALITGTNTATVNGNTLTLNAGGSLMTSFGQTWTRQQ
jgi:hypothetical protein